VPTTKGLDVDQLNFLEHQREGRPGHSALRNVIRAVRLSTYQAEAILLGKTKRGVQARFFASPISLSFISDVQASPKETDDSCPDSASSRQLAPNNHHWPWWQVVGSNH
jgi:hypothetical protein